MTTSPRAADPFRPVQAGWEVAISNWLIPAYFAAIGLPALVVAWVHLRQPPGLVDAAQEKSRQLVDLMAIGVAVFNATAVFTLALACLIVTLMKARPRHADPLPPPP